MAWETATRRKILPIASKAKGSENPVTFRLPKVGILAGIHLLITGAVAGTLSAPNAFGMASIVKRVRLTANNGIDILNFSGPEYHYLLRDQIEDYKDPVADSTARNVVTAVAFDISMYLPVAVNLRDPVGLLMLQSEGTEYTLTVEFEADATVATGATVTATVAPHLVLFSVPADRKDWPDFSRVHRIIAEEPVISATGEYRYKPPRGNAYLQLLYGLGMAQAGSDKFSRVQLATGSDVIMDLTPNAFDIEYSHTHGRARLAGTFVFDFLGSSGLGSYGSTRDIVYSQALTDLDVVITVSTADTLYALRREIVAIVAN